METIAISFNLVLNNRNIGIFLMRNLKMTLCAMALAAASTSALAADETQGTVTFNGELIAETAPSPAIPLTVRYSCRQCLFRR